MTKISEFHTKRVYIEIFHDGNSRILNVHILSSMQHQYAEASITLNFKLSRISKAYRKWNRRMIKEE
jgi:hypothetical protein